MTDKKKKQIIADYLDCGSYREAGRRNGVSGNTAKKVVSENSDIEQLLAQKKEENTLDVLSYLDGKTKSLKRLGDYIMDDRLDPATKKEQLDELPIPQLVTAFGILTDKMLKSKEIAYKTKTETDIGQININIQTLADILMNPVADRKLPEDE